MFVTHLNSVLMTTTSTNTQTSSADLQQRRVKPVSSFKNNCPFSSSLPLSINLRASFWDVPLHLMWQQLAGGLLSLWGDGRSTPLIPIHTGWMEKTEGSTACGSNRPASPLLRPLGSPFFIGEEERGGEEGRKKCWGVSFPMRMLSRGARIPLRISLITHKHSSS